MQRPCHASLLAPKREEDGEDAVLPCPDARIASIKGVHIEWVQSGRVQEGHLEGGTFEQGVDAGEISKSSELACVS